jgi:hypothetical protein
MNFRKTLIGFFIGLALITLTVGLIGGVGWQLIDKTIHEVYQVQMPSILGLTRMQKAQGIIQRAERVLLSETRPEIVARQHQHLSEGWQMADKGWKLFASLPQTPEEAQEWQEFILKWISAPEGVDKKCYGIFPGPLCHTADCPLQRILAEGAERYDIFAEKESADGRKIPLYSHATDFG